MENNNNTNLDPSPSNGRTNINMANPNGAAIQRRDQRDLLHPKVSFQSTKKKNIFFVELIELVLFVSS